MSVTHKLRLIFISVSISVTAAVCGVSASAGNGEVHFIPPKGYEMPYGSSPFAPSNSKTTTGQLISQTEFISATRCAKSHETRMPSGMSRRTETHSGNPSTKPTFCT